MRSIYLICALVFSVGAAFASPPPSIYNFLELASAQECAHACDEDSLCVAWQFDAAKCGLSAVALAPSQDPAIAQGISANAPSFLRPSAPVVTATEPKVVDRTEAQSAPAPQALDDTRAETALLGGPDDSAIRTRLQ